MLVGRGGGSGRAGDRRAQPAAAPPVEQRHHHNAHAEGVACLGELGHVVRPGRLRAGHAAAAEEHAERVELLLDRRCVVFRRDRLLQHKVSDCVHAHGGGVGAAQPEQELGPSLVEALHQLHGQHRRDHTHHHLTHRRWRRRGCSRLGWLGWLGVGLLIGLLVGLPLLPGLRLSRGLVVCSLVCIVLALHLAALPTLMVVRLAPGHCHHCLLIELVLHAQAGERVDYHQLLVSRPLHPQPRAGYLGAPGDGAQSEQRYQAKESHFLFSKPTRSY
eukprot:scaffold83328_cov35-Phaeocystis_antarctica.AAC.1